MRKKSLPFKVIKLEQLPLKVMEKCNLPPEEREKNEENNGYPEKLKETYQDAYLSFSTGCPSESSESSESSQDSDKLYIDESVITYDKSPGVNKRYSVPAFSNYSKPKMVLWDKNPSRLNLQKLNRSFDDLNFSRLERQNEEHNYDETDSLTKKSSTLNKFGIKNAQEKFPFKCDFCDKRLQYLSNLKQHIRTHTGERPFVCEVCNRAFAKKAYLIGHASVHTGEKPYKCYVCDQRCTRKQGLKRHIRRFHQNISPAAYVRSVLGV